MKSCIIKKTISYLSFLMCLFLTLGHVVKIDKYENNFIFFDNNYGQISLSENSFQKIKPKIGKNFYYLHNNINKKKKILNIYKQDNNNLIFLESSGSIKKEIISINYFLEKKSYWENIFLNNGGD